MREVAEVWTSWLSFDVACVENHRKQHIFSLSCFHRIMVSCFPNHGNEDRKRFWHGMTGEWFEHRGKLLLLYSGFWGST